MEIRQRARRNMEDEGEAEAAPAASKEAAGLVDRCVHDAGDDPLRSRLNSVATPWHSS